MHVCIYVHIHVYAYTHTHKIMKLSLENDKTALVGVA